MKLGIVRHMLWPFCDPILHLNSMKAFFWQRLVISWCYILSFDCAALFAKIIEAFILNQSKKLPENQPGVHTVGRNIVRTNKIDFSL